MTRKNIKLAWVENDNARAISLRTRRVGLLKKVKELSILCDINACIIIFSPNEAEPMVWPSVETARGLLDNFFALPRYEHIKKEMDVELYLNEKTNKANEKLIKSCQKNKEYVTNELMMQLQCGRTIDDLNLNEIYTLLSFSRDNIISLRKKLDFMQFSPLRDLPVLPFEAQVEQFKITTNDAFLRGDQDDERAGNTDEATRIINIDSLRENKSYYLIDQWFPTPEPPKPVIDQQIGHGNPNPRGFYPYQGSSSNGNPNLEMMSVCPQVMTFHDLVGSATQPLQHENMNNNPIMAMNQPRQYPFDFMRQELGIQEEGGNINNLQFYRRDNTTTTNDRLCQEPSPNETTAREGNINATSFDINRIWPSFNNHNF
ncbi:unnamed protein product [Arabidopsis arenosa]|uniref:MADS-box domain-containing protein n=1 Tax=Arabidopsis arenosa TaxID=38785 RepID=A0A8S2A746_ARAAE|nr:unnamed protein product [Arabidopsis arenosa]